jgi:DNA-binding GntR family transcriptional regulator
MHSICSICTSLGLDARPSYPYKWANALLSSARHEVASVSTMTTKTAPRTQSPKPAKPAEIKTSDHLYLQVARTLKEEIFSGVHPVGTQLPTEDELCARFSVSRYTVREALRRLREDNLVSSRQGAGTVVVPRHTEDAYAHDVMSINDLVSWSLGKTFVIQSMEMVTLDEKRAERLGLKSGEEWLAVLGFGHDAGETSPACWAEYYINRDFAAVGRLLPRHNGPIFPLIEDLFGLRIVEVHQDTGATLMPADLAETFKVKPASAALEMMRTYKLQGGKIAQVTTSLYPAAQFRHSMTLRRVKG